MGSRKLARETGLGLSAATIRNLMANLEEEGYIASPHTSAGREPTSKGYRFYVDTLLEKDTRTLLPQASFSSIWQGYDNPYVGAAEGLAQASRLAGVVLRPSVMALPVLHLALSPVEKGRVLVVFVRADHAVSSQVVRTEENHHPASLRRAAAFFNEHLSGLCPLEALRLLESEVAETARKLKSLLKVMVANNGDEQEEAFVLTGEDHLLAAQDLASDIRALRRLFNVLKEKTTLLRLMRSSAMHPGVQVAIGDELSLEGLSNVSLVLAPYQVGKTLAGTVAVLGPTRMAYQDMIQLVQTTASRLGLCLSNALLAAPRWN